jgi:hypothetical protein
MFRAGVKSTFFEQKNIFPTIQRSKLRTNAVFFVNAIMYGIEQVIIEYTNNKIKQHEIFQDSPYKWTKKLKFIRLVEKIMIFSPADHKKKNPESLF